MDKILEQVAEFLKVDPATVVKCTVDEVGGTVTALVDNGIAGIKKVVINLNDLPAKKTAKKVVEAEKVEADVEAEAAKVDALSEKYRRKVAK